MFEAADEMDELEGGNYRARERGALIIHWKRTNRAEPCQDDSVEGREAVILRFVAVKFQRNIWQLHRDLLPPLNPLYATNSRRSHLIPCITMFLRSVCPATDDYSHGLWMLCQLCAEPLH
ncbi:hypothetical protein PAXINDRAFT_103462 [Paxillus involutus ATCC 200175]|uniref:Uncharacterized protein n=1 Tax=Paxillus involutus ATCC 200175 TaxID=664439 RepID=A0A0C9TDF5_PAXIN|nr:hypothetical protein PAXINDRAFT_103462 [Paxillus involutus ATCC 200175]